MMVEFPPVYVVSGNNTLLPGFHYQMEQYWPDAFVVYVHYGQLKMDVNSVSIGERVPEEGKWSNGLIDFFREVPDEYFGVMLEDYWLVREVNYAMVSWMFDAAERAGVAKLDLHCGVSRLAHRQLSMLPFGPYGVRWLELDQGERYRTSLHFNIWRKDYFLKLLQPDMSPWQFELCNPGCINDGELILGSLECPVDYCNLMRRNVVSIPELRRIPERDVAEMKRKGIYFP